MTEWREHKLEEIAEIHNQKRIPLSKMQRDKKRGPYPYYGASGVIDYIDEYLFDGEFVLVSEDGENLRSRKTPVAFKASGQFWVNNHAHILKGKKSFHNNLLVQYFSDLDLNEYLTGAVQPKLNKENLQSIPFFLPVEEAEQEAIAGVLACLDDKIDLLHRQNNTLESLSETLFHQTFIEEAQEEWKMGSLGELIELHYGKGLKKSDRTGTGYPVVGSSGIVDYHDEYMVEAPGIVIGRKGTLGKTIFLNDNFHPIDTTYFVKPKNDAGYIFAYYLLKSFDFKEMNSDSAVPGLNRDIALSLELAIPPPEKMVTFETISKPLFEKRSWNTQQIKALENLQGTLLPKLMSGEVRVQFDGAA